MKKIILNRLLDIRNAIILGVVLFYFLLILYPVIFIGSIITYSSVAIVEINWRELKKIHKKSNEAIKKVVVIFE